MTATYHSWFDHHGTRETVLIFRSKRRQMFIQEIILEGFKSYATRTSVSGWDSEFNAITGLNGSGKSNILDAICFVLGISSLSHVRATSLQDLVYKKGQAGICKASVTLVFNNEEREKSPIGYENAKQISITRQIIIGGRNKYIVNGHNKNQQDVANLFGSVGLNVNNPHFLIMQGKITKVLNMKPPEILAMIEEAAGTRMFEDRKEKAHKTMEKKDSKLGEITLILENEITPKFNKLRDAKRAFMEYQKLDNELGHLKRFIAAFQFQNAEKILVSKESALESLESRLTQIDRIQEYLNQDLEELDVKFNEVMETRTKNGGKYVELEAIFKECSNSVVKLKTKLDLTLASISEEQTSQAKLGNQERELDSNIKNSMAKYENRNSEFKKTKQEYEHKVKELQKLEELLETLTVGLAGSEGQDNGYMDQLKEMKKIQSQAASEVEQTRIKIEHLKKEIAASAPKVKNAEKLNGNLINEINTSKKVIEETKAELQGLNFDSSREAQLKEHVRKEEDILNSLEKNLDDLERSLQGLSFNYSDPAPNFDRRKVKGLVAELIDIPERSKNAAIALEVCAGGRLYNVVVDSEVVGTQLLQKGQLKKRVTIIPLNKISAFKVQAERILTAKKVAPGAADLALHLIGYDEEISPAMNFIFGSTLICKDPASAKAVTFHKDIKMRSVTLDGDTYDPSGNLSGGSKSNSGGILLKTGELRSLKAQIRSHQMNLESYVRELDELDNISKHCHSLNQKLELKEHAYALLQERLASNSNAQLINHIEDLKKQLAEQQEALVELKKRQSDAASECKRITKEMEDFSNNKESKLKSLKSNIAKEKKAISDAGPTISNIQLEIDLLKDEFVQCEIEMKSLKELMDTSISSMHALLEEKKDLETQIEIAKIESDKAEKDLKTEKKAIASYDKEIAKIETEKKTKKQELENSKLEAQQLGHDRQTLVNDRDAVSRQIASLLKVNPWIPDQRQNFGKKDSEYYFSGQNMETCQKRLQQMEESHQKLGKSLDADVMEKYDRLEKKEASLKQMFSTVKKDKKKIEETISSLEEYKRDALLKTWRQVNTDFGNIFGDLLPGNSAKLEPTEGKDITEGLEVKVCLGGVWKQSLTELSGGQRSLIALSLILSLLQFKPAPMYILDEVDSALDLSHTQNIGNLLRTRFKGSQFIVVSLKDGMFNNANVLFRTKFRDGVSTVDRITQRNTETPKTKAVAKEVVSRSRSQVPVS